MGLRPGQAKGPSVTKGSGGGLASVTTADTNTVDLTGDGTGGLPLEADVIVSPDPGNLLSAVANGLYSANPVLGLMTYRDRAELLAIVTDNSITRAIGIAPVTLLPGDVLDLHGRSLWVSGEPLDLPNTITVSNGALYIDGKFRTNNAATTIVLSAADLYTDSLISNTGAAATLTITSATGNKYAWSWNDELTSIVTAGNAIIRHIVQGDGEPIGPAHYKYQATQRNVKLGQFLGESGTWIFRVTSGSGGFGSCTMLVEKAKSGQYSVEVMTISGFVYRVAVSTSEELWVDIGAALSVEMDIFQVSPIYDQNTGDFLWSPVSDPVFSALNNIDLVTQGGGFFYTATSARQTAPATLSIDIATAVATKGYVDGLQSAQNTLTKEPTGWDNPANVAVTYDIATRKVTAKAISGTATAYWRGVALLTIDTVTGFTSAAHANTLDVAYYLYYNGSTWSFGNVPAETTPWEFDYLMLAFCYYGTADKWAIRECHGMMPYQSHREDHYNIGTWRRPGATNYGAVTFTGALPSGTTAARRRPTIAACELWDEDLVTTNPAQSSNYCPCYLTGLGAVSTFLENNADIVPFASATTRAAYNNPNGGGAGVWGLTALATSEFTPVFAVQVPVTTDANSQQYRVLHYLGQAAYSTAAAAQAVEFNTLNLGTFFNVAPEFLVIQRYVIRGNNANDLWEVESTQQIVGYKASQVSVASTGMVNPMTTLGDMIYASASGTPATPQRLGIGSANFDLGIVAGIPAWRASIYSLLTAGGQVLASSGANTPVAVAAGTAGQVLTSNGAAAPTFQTPSAGSAVRTYSYAQPAGVGAGQLVAAAGTYIAGFNIGQTMLAAGTIRALVYSSLGASAAGTIQISINGGAFQTLATIVGGAAPAHERLATTAIAVASGDYITMQAGTASFSTACTITFEVS